MHKFGKQVRVVLGGVLFIGLTVQMILGIFWMLGNFGGFQQFPDSYRLVGISKSFLCDEYTGIIYPVFIMLARGVQKLFHIPYYCILYFVQLMVGCYAAHRFALACGIAVSHREKSTESKLFWDIWAALCILTIPAVLQCHLAVLPNSLTLSCFLVLISYAMEAAGISDRLHVTLVKMVPLWLASSLLMPEYLILSALPVLYLFCYSMAELWRKNRRQLLRSTAMLAMVVVVILTAGTLTQIPGSHGKMRGGISSMAVRRFVWPWFTENYGFWPEEIREIMNEEQAREISWYTDYVTDVFGPMVEDAAGLEQAKSLYREMAAISFQIHTRDIVKAAAWDVLSYVISPLMLMRELRGFGQVSYSGRNYEIMKNHMPGLTRNYVWYGNWWFCAGVGLGIVYLLLKLIPSHSGRDSRRKSSGSRGKLLAVAGAGMVLWYTMAGAGIMDYKNTVFLTLLWYAFLLKAAKEALQEGKPQI